MMILYVILILILIYYLYTKHITYNYWKRKNVPSMNPIFPVGNMASCIFQRSSLGEYNLKIYNHFKQNGVEYGGIYVFTTPVFVPISPEMIKNILKNDFEYFTNRTIIVNKEHDPFSEHIVFMKDEEWRNLRRKISPTFTSKKLKDMIPLVIECCDVLVENIKDNINKNEDIFILEKMKKLSLDIIGSTVFGLNCNTLQDPKNDFYNIFTAFTEITVDNTFSMLFLLMYSKILDIFKIPLTSQKLRDVVTNILKDTIKNREETDEKRNDFLNLLMEMMKQKENGITFNQLMAQAFSFIIAGYETVTSTLTFCLLEIAQNKYIYDKLMDEINVEMKKNHGQITYDCMREMKYLHMVIQETLRKHTFCSGLFRKCNKDYKIPNTDIVIEKGTNVWIPIIGVHKDSEFYPDPDDFNPERFNPENIGKRHPYSFLAYGQGPRICIGLRSSYIQLKVILIVLLTNLKICRTFDSDRLPSSIAKKAGLFVTPKDDIKMKFQII